MAPTTRRAAGTQTFTDVMKIWFGGKRPSPAADLADYRAGMALEVSCFARLAADTMAPRLGTLLLDKSRPPTWRHRADTVIFEPPITLADSRAKPKGPQLKALTLTGAVGSYEIHVPSLDIELVREALKSA